MYNRQGYSYNIRGKVTLKGYKRYIQTLLVTTSLGILGSSAGFAISSMQDMHPTNEPVSEVKDYEKIAEAYENLANIAYAKRILKDPSHFCTMLTCRRSGEQVDIRIYSDETVYAYLASLEHGAKAEIAREENVQVETTP